MPFEVICAPRVTNNGPPGSSTTMRISPFVCKVTCAAWLQVRCMAGASASSQPADPCPHLRRPGAHGSFARPAVLAACGLARCVLHRAHLGYTSELRVNMHAHEKRKRSAHAAAVEWPRCTLCGAGFHAFGFRALDALRSATFHVGSMGQPFGEDLPNGVPMPHLPYQEQR